MKNTTTNNTVKNTEMKKQKTNSKHVKELVKAYILETVHDHDGEEFKTFEEAAKHLKSDFEIRAGHAYNLKRYPNVVDRFLDYLQGMPFYFPAYVQDVEDFLNSLGINPEGKKYSSDRMNNLYALLIYREIEKY